MIKLDFGVAEVFPDGEDQFQSTKWCGKIAYKSPEVLSKKKTFNAQANDIWCLGICLFNMICGSAPFKMACKTDALFVQMMNNGLVEVLSAWGKITLVDKSICQLFQRFFQYEDKRITLQEIKKSEWFQNISCSDQI